MGRAVRACESETHRTAGGGAAGEERGERSAPVSQRLTAQQAAELLERRGESSPRR
jgi:hypothetical protein